MSASSETRVKTKIMITDGLSACPTVEEAVPYLKADHPKVTYLHFTQDCFQNGEMDALVEALDGNTNLTHVDFIRCQLGDENVIKLASVLERTGIKFLGLSKNNITDVGMAELAKSINTIEDLTLSHNCIWNFTVFTKVLREGKLQELNLFNNSIQLHQCSNAAGNVFEALATNTTLVSLTLAYNNIVNAEGFLKLTNCLKRNKCLKNLYVEDIRLDSRYISELGKILDSNDVIEVIHVGHRPDLPLNLLSREHRASALAAIESRAAAHNTAASSSESAVVAAEDDDEIHEYVKRDGKYVRIY